MLGGAVDFDVPVDVAYAYLADPRNRPEWQASLKSVEMLDEGEPRVGMRWRDHTAARIAPEMEITAMDPGELWAETGQWRGISAILMLSFEPAATGCVVHVMFRVRGRGPPRPGRAGWPPARELLPVMSDVKRAARILEEGRADGTRCWLALSALMIVAGLVFTFQGLGYIKGSAMTGVAFWAVVGPVLAGFGVALGIVSFRGRR